MRVGPEEAIVGDIVAILGGAVMAFILREEVKELSTRGALLSGGRRRRRSGPEKSEGDISSRPY